MVLDGETFEHDVTLLDRYLAFSAELARLSILAIGAIGYLITNNAFAATKVQVKTWLWIALVALGLSTAAALAHRYFAPDSLGNHLELLRHHKGGLEQPAEAVDAEKGRNWKFSVAGTSIAVSAACLAIGVGALAACCGIWLANS